MEKDRLICIKNSKVLYHACGAFYYDRTLPLITKEVGCSRATEYPFWKDPEYVKNSVKTRSQKRVAPFIGPSMINAYFDHKSKIKSRYEQLMSNKNTDNESTD